MASYRPDLSGALQPPGGPSAAGGPLLSLSEWAALATAPRRPPGTEVTVRAKPVYIAGWPTGADHMFETFDDGSGRYIYRGGPRGPSLHAQVDPADLSPDFNAESRVLDRRFLPGVSAAEAIKPAQADAARLNRLDPLYGILGSNSNSVIGGFTKSQYGRRVGDRRTWGYDTDPIVVPFPIDPLAPTT